MGIMPSRLEEIHYVRLTSYVRAVIYIFTLTFIIGCAVSLPVVKIMEVSTMDYYGDLATSINCYNSADRPYFYTLRIEFTDDNGVVKEVQEPYLLIGGGETDELAFTSSHPGVTRVRCIVKNCSPQ